MKFYRYKDIRYTDRVRIHLNEYVLVKETLKGYWIKDDWDKYDDHKRWVSKDGKSRYAYPTKEEAMVNFLARKKRQIEILEYKLRNARMALFYGEQM